jgi:phosphotransferase system HPr (HPr) family protein
MDALTVTRTVTVQHAQGLHARPAELIARQALKFQAEIELARDQRHVDCKSILNVLTLGATQGTVLVLVARGEDAEQAVEALARLVESDFPEQAPQSEKIEHAEGAR